MKYLSFWLAFLLALYVYARVNRYEFIATPGGENFGGSMYIFDRWTRRVDAPRITKEHFVADPFVR